jgi:hypothetical protein
VLRCARSACSVSGCVNGSASIAYLPNPARVAFMRSMRSRIKLILVKVMSALRDQRVGARLAFPLLLPPTSGRAPPRPQVAIASLTESRVWIAHVPAGPADDPELWPFCSAFCQAGLLHLVLRDSPGRALARPLLPQSELATPRTMLGLDCRPRRSSARFGTSAWCLGFGGEFARYARRQPRCGGPLREPAALLGPRPRPCRRQRRLAATSVVRRKPGHSPLQ